MQQVIPCRQSHTWLLDPSYAKGQSLSLAGLVCTEVGYRNIGVAVLLVASAQVRNTREKAKQKLPSALSFIEEVEPTVLGYATVGWPELSVYWL